MGVPGCTGHTCYVSQGSDTLLPFNVKPRLASIKTLLKKEQPISLNVHKYLMVKNFYR